MDIMDESEEKKLKESKEIELLTASIKTYNKQINDLQLVVDWTKDKDIIYYLRNAVAHGNVWVSKYDDDINECVLTFIDNVNGKVEYQKDIKLADFINLFSKDHSCLMTEAGAMKHAASKKDNKGRVNRFVESKRARKILKKAEIFPKDV